MPAISGITHDSENNRILILDEQNNRWQRFSREGTFIQHVNLATNNFDAVGMTFDAARNLVAVLNADAARIFRYMPDGTESTHLILTVAGNNLRGVAYDSADDEYLVIDHGNRTWRRYNAADGSYINLYNLHSDNTDPTGITYDTYSNRVMVADASRNATFVYTDTGEFIKEIPNPTGVTNVQGLGFVSEFNDFLMVDRRTMRVYTLHGSIKEDLGNVSYVKTQDLTDLQRQRARTNIGFDLLRGQKEITFNIGAITVNTLYELPDYTVDATKGNIYLTWSTDSDSVSRYVLRSEFLRLPTFSEGDLYNNDQLIRIGTLGTASVYIGRTADNNILIAISGSDGQNSTLVIYREPWIRNQQIAGISELNEKSPDHLVPANLVSDIAGASKTLQFGWRGGFDPTTAHDQFGVRS